MKYLRRYLSSVSYMKYDDFNRSWNTYKNSKRSALVVVPFLLQHRSNCVVDVISLVSSSKSALFGYPVLRAQTVTPGVHGYTTGSWHKYSHRGTAGIGSGSFWIVSWFHDCRSALVNFEQCLSVGAWTGKTLPEGTLMVQLWTVRPVTWARSTRGEFAAAALSDSGSCPQRAQRTNTVMLISWAAQPPSHSSPVEQGIEWRPWKHRQQDMAETPWLETPWHDTHKK